MENNTTALVTRIRLQQYFLFRGMMAPRSIHCGRMDLRELLSMHTAEQGIPIVVTWSLGGKSVYVEGSWDNWRSIKVIIFIFVTYLSACLCLCRFIVDGKVKVTCIPSEPDEMDCLCNLLDVHTV